MIRSLLFRNVYARSFLVTGLALAFSSAYSGAWAQSARIGIVVDDGVASSCEVTLTEGIHTLSIRVDGTVAPVKTARFKVMSSCPVVFYGTPANQEYDLTFPTCIDAGDEIENFGILVQGGTQVCTIEVAAVTGATDIELMDCEGYPMIGGWTHADPYCTSLAGYLAPYRPNPPTGATDVPTNTLLSYIGPANVVVFGTSPIPDPDDPDAILCTSHIYPPGKPSCALPLDPGLLAPHTTYYWRAYNLCFGCYDGEGALSEVFSFTTGEGPLAVESATWGSVKAMYRE